MTNVYNGSVVIWREMFQMVNGNKKKYKQCEANQTSLEHIKKTKLDIPEDPARI